MPSIVQLPPRVGSLKFSEDDVTAVIDLLGKLEPGQAVKLHDDPDEKENTSRRRAEIMKEQIEQRGNGAIREGYRIRGHVLTAGEPEVRKVSGKNYKFFPENWGAISLVPEDPAPATPAAPDAPDAPENPAPDNPDGAGADSGTEGRGRRSRS